jgi:SOS-response transcriptional repressor LexA
MPSEGGALPQAWEQDAEGRVSVDVEGLGFKPTCNSFALHVTRDSMICRHILARDVIVRAPPGGLRCLAAVFGIFWESR